MTDVGLHSQNNLPLAAVELKVDYFHVLDRLQQEVKDCFPDSLKMFSPLQSTNMDMLEAEKHLATLAETYELHEERLIAQWKAVGVDQSVLHRAI